MGMAMRAGGGGRTVVADINVTPMADVVIVLLIICMVTIPRLHQPPVSLPWARYASERPKDGLRVMVTGNGRVTLEGMPPMAVPDFREYLRARLATSTGPAPVLIEADRGADYELIARVLEACRVAGVEEIGLATQPLIEP
jgi:biopolymer transport protein TolR